MSQEQDRIDSIEAHLAKIRLRLKAHKAVDLKQINQMSDEISSLLGRSSSLEQKASSEKIHQKGSFVSSTLEQMRQLLWEQDYNYLKEINRICFSLDELIYSIPFEEPLQLDKKLEELTHDLSSLVKTMTVFSPRVEEKIEKAYSKLQDLHFVLQFPICLELKKHFYFPNFRQQIEMILASEEKEKMIKTLSQKQQKKIKGYKDLKSFLEELENLYEFAKKAFFSHQSASEIIKELDKSLCKVLDLENSDDPKEITHKIVGYLQELILS